MSFLRIPRNVVGVIMIAQFFILVFVIGVFALQLWTRFEIVPCVPI